MATPGPKSGLRFPCDYFYFLFGLISQTFIPCLATVYNISGALRSLWSLDRLFYPFAQTLAIGDPHPGLLLTLWSLLIFFHKGIIGSGIKLFPFLPSCPLELIPNILIIPKIEFIPKKQCGINLYFLLNKRMHSLAIMGILHGVLFKG